MGFGRFGQRAVGLSGRVDRLAYLAFGVTLLALKALLDWLLATRAFGEDWSWTHYLPSGQFLLARGLLDRPRSGFGHSQSLGFVAAMLLLSAPFVWAGVVLTVERLRAARLPLWLAVLFFVPMVNFVLFAALCVVPSKPVEIHSAERGVHIGAAASVGKGSFWRAVVICVGVGWICAHTNAYVLGIYGAGLFVGLPFALGMMSAAIHGAQVPRTRRACVGVAITSVTMLGVVLFITLFEGLICLLMASPIWIACASLGGLVGHAIQRYARDEREVTLAVVTVLLAVPVLLGAEAVALPAAPVFVAESVMEIDARPEQVWARVVSFPDLAPPTEWFFRAGIAFPIGATIAGHGPGAERRCKFSTGDFVEPITVWDEPRLLRFDVTANPEPMVEWSYSDAIHPPHLNGFMISRAGQFRLVELEGGRTRLEGSTWYQHHLWPAAYWRLWSDNIVHAIHRRVLTHIRDLSEGDATAARGNEIVRVAELAP
jgi:uncharacterized membrane protein YhaH (DUF805 family)